MKVQVSILPDRVSVEWPDDWPIPSKGDGFDLPPDEYDGPGLVVREVVWYPLGEEESDEPFVYIVVGPHRP